MRHESTDRIFVVAEHGLSCFETRYPFRYLSRVARVWGGAGEATVKRDWSKSHTHRQMARLDEIDRRILYRLAEDARGTSAPTIAEEVNVSAGTIRNRIDQLEEDGILTGYHAAIDYERADDSLRNLFVCDVSVTERAHLATQALAIPGVVNVRELMSGRGNLHVTAVGADTEDLSRISHELSSLGVDIQGEDLVQSERTRSYQPYGPEEDPMEPSMTDFLNLSGEAEVVDLTIAENAAIAGLTLREANEDGLLGDEILVVAIERGESIITPKGHTTIQAGDLVTVFGRTGITDDFLGQFTGSAGN